MTKSVDDPAPNVGDVVTFTVNVTNNGPNTATNVSLSDVLPAGLEFVGAAPGPGRSYDQATGVWTVGTLASTASAVLQIQARVVSPGATDEHGQRPHAQ